MQKINWNSGWLFALENELDARNCFGLEKIGDASGATARFYDYSNWKAVDLPHDWAISLPVDLRCNTFAGARACSSYHRFMTERHVQDDIVIYNVGWYRKQFMFDELWTGKRVFIEFEGIFRDAHVWVNEVFVDRHMSGYTGFTLDITDFLFPGEENSIVVRVDSEHPEGWWYEGAGIYRNVNLLLAEPVHTVINGTVVRPRTDGTIDVRAALRNDGDDDFEGWVSLRITDKNGCVVCGCEKDISVASCADVITSASLKADDPHLWQINDPYLYTLEIRVGEEIEKVRFGIRSAVFDAEKGFLLNGNRLKIHGVCCHQDMGGAGVALTDNLQYYRIRELKEMGVNAVRFHHAPAPSLLDACDELGMLVVDETRMFGTSPEALRQLTDLVERDRNRPSVILWSLGNEEFTLQDTEKGRFYMKKMSEFLLRLDDTREITYAGSNAYNFTGINGAAGVRGVNYIRNHNGWGSKWLDKYHELHPKQPIIGTEEGSHVQSSGCANNDIGSGVLDCFGDVSMPWGSTPESWVKYYEARDYLAGGFLWTGFDYHGEPNPFITSNVSSMFGAVDLCGIPKPVFYYYRAWWTDAPVLRIAPHWDFRPGETVEIAVFTNCDDITLFVNGKERESRKIRRFDMPVFSVVYEPGEISVIGKKDGAEYTDSIKTSGEAVGIRCIPVLMPDKDDDIGIFQLEAYDKNGTFCRTASDLVDVSVSDGICIGVSNGDAACVDYEQKTDEDECVFIRNFRYEHGMYSVPLVQENVRRNRFDRLVKTESQEGFPGERRYTAVFSDEITEKETLTFISEIRLAEDFDYIEFERLGGTARVFVDGEEIGNNLRSYGRMPFNNVRPYRFYRKINAGEHEISVVSEHYGNGIPPISGTVRLGRKVSIPWTVRLHFGRARVFVRKASSGNFAVRALLKDHDK